MTFYNANRYFVALALPMIISNVFLPLVGLVDTAIVGHLPGAHFLSGVALGSLLITQVIWICGFLRMSVTGLSAQSRKEKAQQESMRLLQQGCLLATIIGIGIWVLSPLLFKAGVYFSGVNSDVQQVASTYFYTRVVVAPVSLINLVLIGWLLGRQQHKQVMRIQILANVFNILLSVGLALGLELQTLGVAMATAISECIVLVLSIKLIFSETAQWQKIESGFRLGLSRLLKLNRDVFLRNICLQLYLAVFTYLGLQQGELTGAANAVLMQFFVLVALGLDGVAYAAEALIGEAWGQKNKKKLLLWTKVGFLLSGAFAIFYSLIFALLFYEITRLLTDLDSVLNFLQQFKIYIVLMPLIAHWSFLLDGMYVGMTLAKPMLTTMLISVLSGLVFISINLGQINADILWQSFLLFLLVRGILLGTHFYRRVYNGLKA